MAPPARGWSWGGWTLSDRLGVRIKLLFVSEPGRKRLLPPVSLRNMTPTLVCFHSLMPYLSHKPAHDCSEVFLAKVVLVKNTVLAV